MYLLRESTSEIEFNRYIFLWYGKPEVTALSHSLTEPSTYSLYSLFFAVFALRINFFTSPKYKKSNEVKIKVNINKKSYFVTSKKWLIKNYFVKSKY